MWRRAEAQMEIRLQYTAVSSIFVPAGTRNRDHFVAGTFQERISAGQSNGLTCTCHWDRTLESHLGRTQLQPMFANFEHAGMSHTGLCWGRMCWQAFVLGEACCLVASSRLPILRQQVC